MTGATKPVALKIFPNSVKIVGSLRTNFRPKSSPSKTNPTSHSCKWCTYDLNSDKCNNFTRKKCKSWKFSINKKSLPFDNKLPSFKQRSVSTNLRLWSWKKTPNITSFRFSSRLFWLKILRWLSVMKIWKGSQNSMILPLISSMKSSSPNFPTKMNTFSSKINKISY